MDRLKPVLTAVDDPAELRRVCQVQLQSIKAEQDILGREAKLIRDILNRYSGPSDLLDSRGRTQKVLDAAVEMARHGREVFSPREMVDWLRETAGFEFDVKKPASLVGTVLARHSKEFERLADGRFRIRAGRDGGETGE